MNMTSDQLLKTPTEIKSVVEDIRRLTSPDRIEAHFASIRQQALDQMTVMGVAPRNAAQQLDDIEEKKRSAYDIEVREKAKFALEALAAVDAELQAHEQHASVLREPTGGTTSDRMLTRLVWLSERQELRNACAGLSLPEVMEIYKSLSDSDHAAQVAFLESEIDTGFKTIAVKRTDAVKDTAALKRFQEQRDERRRKRVPTYVQETRVNLNLALSNETRVLVAGMASPATGRPAMARFKTTKERLSEQRDGFSASLQP